MSQNINIIRNPDFARGKSAPTSWDFRAETKNAGWRRIPGNGADAGKKPTGVAVTSARKGATAHFSQVVACKPGEFYRVEATVDCELEAGGDSSGLVIAVQALRGDRPSGRRLVTLALQRSSAVVAIRAVYEAPEEVRRVRVSVGIERARGVANIRHVRFIKILEPEEESHVLAIPPPRSMLPPAPEARSVCVCSADAETRPVTSLLSACLGEGHVRAIRPGDLRTNDIGTDALLLADEAPPPRIRSLNTLMTLARRRIVIISLPAFARLANGMLSLRRVEQEDDPINARVVYSNRATHGFALQDAFAYSWAGSAEGSFVQNQYRRTPALKSFCAKHGLVTLLHSLCDQDVTSERPIALHKQFENGALFVLDIDPVEAAGSTRNEPALAMHLLLSALGRPQAGLGQYVVPATSEEEFRTHIRDMSDRFEEFVVHDADVPVDEVTEQIVTIGREDESFGLPLEPKPLILLRSGLRSGDMESVYGSFMWVKQLIRMAPATCPYAEELASAFRFAWVPCLAPWDAPDGWRRAGDPPAHPMTLDLEDSKIAAVIDIVSIPANRIRVVFPADNAAFMHCAAWLPQLVSAFPPGRYFSPTVKPGDGFQDRDRLEWRYAEHDVQVDVDAGPFDDQLFRDVTHSGGQAIRLEVPGSSADFVARSIQRTDLAATLLEHVIGLQYGLIAVNRGPAPAQLDALPPVEPGGKLVIHRRDPLLRGRASRAV